MLFLHYSFIAELDEDWFKNVFQTKAIDKFKEIINTLPCAYVQYVIFCAKSKHVHQGSCLCILFLYVVYVNGCIRTMIMVNLF